MHENNIYPNGDWRDIDDLYAINSDGVVIYKPTKLIKSVKNGEVRLHNKKEHKRIKTLLYSVGFLKKEEKKIYAYNKQGHLIHEYRNIEECTKDGYSYNGIVACVNGHIMSHKSVVFRYDGDDFKKYKTPKIKESKQIKIFFPLFQGYTKEECHTKALKYKTKTEFKRSIDNKYYQYAWKYGFLDEICSHMEVNHGLERRCIYAYEFYLNEEKYVYVGLTYNIKKRNSQHYQKGSVYRFCNENHITIPQVKIIYDYLSPQEASIKEDECLQAYIQQGYIPINQMKCGSLGAPWHRTENEIITKFKENAATSKGRKDCRQKGWGVYDWVKRNKPELLDELLPIKHIGEKSTAELMGIVKDYKTRRAAFTDFPQVVNILSKRGITLWEKPQKKEKIKKNGRIVIVRYKGDEYVGKRNDVAEQILPHFKGKSKSSLLLYIGQSLKTGEKYFGLFAEYKD